MTAATEILNKLNKEQNEFLISHQLIDYLDLLAQFKSTKKLKKALIYRTLLDDLNEVDNGIEYGFYADNPPYERKPFYRIVAWNVERGLELEGIIHTLKNHPELSRADLYYIIETDIGMARTKNRNVAQELAKALGMNYFFAPSYLNLAKGNSIEGHFEGENKMGLHGNALLSRYPIENLRTIRLMNCKDKMKGGEKRLGCQKVLVADVLFPFKKMTAVVAHLDAHSSQRQRAKQMQTILASLQHDRYPVLVGGDLNTNTYNTSHAFYAFLGFWNKVLRGVDSMIDEHYPFPDRKFDKRLFNVLKNYGFDYENFNEKGVGTLHYQVDHLEKNHLVQEVVPKWCRRVMEETLRKHGGRVSLKLDWFTGRWLKVANLEKEGVLPPKVFQNLSYQGKPLSDHDPISVDIDLYE